MTKTTLKEIKQHQGENITNYTREELNQLIQETGDLIVISYSVGTYGWNGLLAYSNNFNKFYKVTARTIALFML